MRRISSKALPPAAEAGIREGDVIPSFNNEPVSPVEDLARMTNKAKGSVAVLILRDNARVYVPLKLG